MIPGLGVTHTCRDFEKIKDWAFERWVNYDNLRSVVEDGKVVDYSFMPASPLDIPQDWDMSADEFAH
jgi:hypothetical protein